MRIRSHLALLAVGAMLPILGFAVLVSVILLEQHRSTTQRAAMDRARAMMTAIDAELRGSFGTLAALAASASLEDGDLRAFHAEAARVLATQPTWTSVTLVRPTGEKLIDAATVYGKPLPAVADPASIARVVATAGPVTGNVDVDVAGVSPAVPMRVPVMRGRNVAYVLTALVRPDAFEDLIRQQRLPAGWICGIIDASGRFIARVPPRPVGDLSSIAFRTAILQQPEGWSRGLSVEGRDVFTAHEVSNFSNWSIGLAIPAEVVLAGIRNTALLSALGVLASIAVAMAIVVSSGRRIARPIVALAAVARSIGAGHPGSEPVAGDVREVREVAAALHDADAAVRERQLLIQREKDLAQAADRAKDEFIAALSHELRNPLAAITAASHILRVVEPTHAAAADARGVIHRQTKHMSRMVEDLLDVSRIIMGKANLTIEGLDLGKLARNTVDVWRAAGRFDDRNVSVHAEPVWIAADRTRMEQILANLLDNAVKFTSEGTRIAVTVGSEAGFAVLRVADEGPGIGPDLMPRVFDVFVQGEQGVGRARGGMGVGLTLVKRLTEMQHGSIAVGTGPGGRGAEFTLKFPVVAAPVSIANAPPADASRAEPRRVLVIEDNPDGRDMLRQVLLMRGHDVRDVPDGITGVAQALEHRPDVAIVDIGLPDIDGYQVARRIRDALNGDVALIALSGYGQPENKRRALEAGFDVYLVKPVTVEALDGAIARVTSPGTPASLRTSG